ncbi:MAG: ATP-binding protein [Deltaproteobacteria bacterium]|nr:ATP-binding protein [Deltaproteobacteria bacterium]
MTFISRILNLSAACHKRSYFLFGPRQTGKSSLIRQTLPDAIVYDLLDSTTYAALSRDPTLLRQESMAQQDKNKLIVIDEIQKLPILLDEVHLQIERFGHLFLLTGSNARKLRRGGVNLLGGRARTLYLHPFVYQELKDFDLHRVLNIGLLPSIYSSDDPEGDLSAYIGAYIQEEIAAEAVVRNIPAFSRFLEVAAFCNGAIINYSAIANDAQVARTTVQEYFAILKDTLIAREVPAFNKTRKRKALATSKCYFFDTGVVRSLRHQGQIALRSPEAGLAFETYICHELASYLDYTNSGELYYWRSASGFEVDFIINGQLAIEVKASAIISKSDLRGHKALREESLVRDSIIVCLVNRPRIIDGIKILPYTEFLKRLWDGHYRL